MNSDQVSEKFSMLIQEFEREIHGALGDGAKAFEEKRYEDITRLVQKAKGLESFQSRIAAIKDEWSVFAEESGAEGGPQVPRGIQDDIDHKRKWTKHVPATPVAFQAECIARVSAYLQTEFIKQTRSSFVSQDGRIALVVSVSREHEVNGRKFCWFSFHPYQGEFLASKPNGYLLLGCGAPDCMLLIPFCDFLPWSQKLNRSVREDGSFYRHVRIYVGNNTFRLKLEGRGNHVDASKYVIAKE